MIISSGVNVYPSQIESVIEEHPAVASCAVIGVDHPYKEQVQRSNDLSVVHPYGFPLPIYTHPNFCAANIFPLLTWKFFVKCCNVIASWIVTPKSFQIVTRTSFWSH